MTFDRIDLKIHDNLHRDATVPVARIAEQVGLSQTPCWKRIEKHEGAGVIRDAEGLRVDGSMRERLCQPDKRPNDNAPERPADAKKRHAARCYQKRQRGGFQLGAVTECR